MREGLGGRSLAALAVAFVLLLPHVAQPIEASAKPRQRANDAERVVGGSVAGPGQFPFVVALMESGKEKDPVDQQFCGGSIISDRFVLTAAHCVGASSRSRMRVLAGQTSLRDSGGQVRRVVAVHRYPRYSNAGMGFDAAVLELDKPLQFNEAVAPVRLVASGDASLQRAGVSAFVAGWGSLVRQVPTRPAERPKYPSALRATAVPIAAAGVCQRANMLSKSEAQSIICAGSGARDSCQGDSGGPLFVHRNDEWVQIGVVSGGFGCAAPKYPGMYTRLSNPAINQWVSRVAGL